MNLKESLLELGRSVGLLIDDELIELSDKRAFMAPPAIHQVKGKLFTVNYWDEISLGDTVIPRVSWGGTLGLGYTDEEVEDLLDVIRRLPQFGSALTMLSKAETKSRDVGALQLYLICFAFYVESTLLKNRWADLTPIVEAFLQDLEKDDISIIVKLGLRGVHVKDEPVRIADGVKLRRLARSDYHEAFVPLADRQFRRVRSPSEYHASAILEISLKPAEKLAGAFLPTGFIDFTIHSSIKEFDVLIQHALASASTWRDTLSLVQSVTDVRTGLIQVEFLLPVVSPVEPVYRYEWKEEGSWQEARSSFAISSADKQVFDLVTTLVSQDYSKKIFARDGRQTPLSLAYSRYSEILHSYESDEATIQREVEALEAFFTPETAKSKVFIKRVYHMIKTIAVDENDTENLLYNSYIVRNSRVHRGEGWDKYQPPESTTKQALYAWQNYMRDLTTILLGYLRLSIVSRLLSKYDEWSYFEALDKSIKSGVADDSLSGQTKYLSCRIGHVNDFLSTKKASAKYDIPDVALWKAARSKKLDAMMLRRPGKGGKPWVFALIPEWALERMASETPTR